MPENRFIFVFEGTPRSGEITYNTKLVNSSRDQILLGFAAPKMERQVCLGRSVPVSGPISAAHIFFYKHPDLGPEFLRRFHADTEIAIVRSNEQMLDWLSAGKYAFGIGARDVDTAMMQGPAAQSISPCVAQGRFFGDGL